MKKQLLFLWVFMLSTVYAQAQLSGTKNVPGDYPDIQSAITALNTQGVGSGGVTIILGANQTLTAPLQMDVQLLQHLRISILLQHLRLQD